MVFRFELPYVWHKHTLRHSSVTNSAKVMRTHLFIVSLIFLAACSTPNPRSGASDAAYDRIKEGMTRHEVYDLLGPPCSTDPTNDADHCRTATWSIPHNSRGWGHWTVNFNGDVVANVDTDHAIVAGSFFH
jgi:hypothetical protein